MDTKLTVVIAVVVGAAMTWLWTRENTQPMPEAATVTQPSASQRVAPQRTPFEPASATRAPTTRPALDVAHPAQAIALPVPASFQDNSTFDRMLATAQTYPDWLNIAGNLTKMHERFMLAPDDPAWARPMEQSLRDFFSERTKGQPFEFTSIACRAGRCEVQVQVQAQLEGNPKMLEPVHDTRPLGHSVLRQDAIEGVVLGDRVGMLISYEQVQPETAEAQGPTDPAQ